MPSYVVFLDPPPPCDAFIPSAKYEWSMHTLPLSPEPSPLVPSEKRRVSSWAGYAPATLEAASRRISLLYRNVIFDEQASEMLHAESGSGISDNSEVHREHATTYAYDPTEATPGGMETFLHASPSRLAGDDTQDETQFTALSSDASSLVLFPAFRFHLSAITPLSALRTRAPRRAPIIPVAVLEIEGPDFIKIKRGSDVGKEVAVLKVIVGDDDGIVAKCTAWRDVAETWGDGSGIKRGDIVCLSNIQSSWDVGSPLALTASPNLRSQAEICYRTMPRASFAEFDARLRPELDLDGSDPAVRRVGALVQWFKGMAGLPA